MEEIIKSITEAEKRAAEIKEQALNKAADIAAQAEERAAEIEKLSEAECKALREKSIQAAYDDAREKYEGEIKQKRAEAAVYASGCLKKADRQVSGIIRRVTGGGR